MTNSEYEAACIVAAGCSKAFEGMHRLKQYDEVIAQVENTLARLQAERREIVNFYNLNKCEHDYIAEHFGELHCRKCGEERSINGTRN